MKDVLVLWQYGTKIVTFCCNLTSISIIRKCVCYCSCNGVQKCQTVEVTHHNNKQLRKREREKKPLTSQEVLVIEQVVKWSFDFEVHTQCWWCALNSAVHTRLRLWTLDHSPIGMGPSTCSLDSHLVHSPSSLGVWCSVFGVQADA